MPDGFFRVFWISSIWLVPSFFYGVVFIRNRFARFFSVSFFFIAILATYSRGLWIGVSLGLFVFFLSHFICERRGGGRVIIVLLVIVHLIGLLVYIFHNSGFWSRVDSLYSDAFSEGGARGRQVSSLLSAWYDNPVIGSGFGSSAEVVRSVTTPYVYEMIPFALLMKLGLLGFFIFFSFFGFVFITGVFSRGVSVSEKSAFSAAFISFITSSMTNPILFNFVGVTVLCALLIHWSSIVARSKNLVLYRVQ